MLWNWKQPGWPGFKWDPKALEAKEHKLLHQSGEFARAFRHISLDDKNAPRVELIGEEAVKTSQIEGEILNRESVQSSFRHHLGLGPHQPNTAPPEGGIAKMMIDLYRHYARPERYWGRSSDVTLMTFRQQPMMTQDFLQLLVR